MTRVAVVGLGKMGLSHLAILGADPEVEVVGACDATAYLVEVLRRNTGMACFTDAQDMLARTRPDAVVVATPTAHHDDLVRAALMRDAHVFCEKPLTLAHGHSEELAALADERGLVSQVGYHNRFVGSFGEVKRLLDLRVLGRVSRVHAEAYGPVVLRAKTSTWRSKRAQGGGCLYDYAAHPLDLLDWFFGEAERVRGAAMRSVFSAETDDEVMATLDLPQDVVGQLTVSWSDESHRKMTTRVTIEGEHGKIYADRQEVQVYLRSTTSPPEGYRTGWTVRYTTDLTDPVGYYLRGEEYSAQLAHFVRAAADGAPGRPPAADFASATRTDRVIARIVANASADLDTATRPVATVPVAVDVPRPRGTWLRRLGTRTA